MINIYSPFYFIGHVDSNVYLRYLLSVDEGRSYSWHKLSQEEEEDLLGKLAERETQRSSNIVVGLLCILLAGIWITHFISDWLPGWGISWSALMQGRLETVALHMFAHAGLMHLVCNVLALWSWGTQVMDRMGSFPSSLWRFSVFYMLSGLVAAIAYLLLHSYGSTPMVGASGAICGLLGALWRISPDSDELLPIWSRRTRILAKRFAWDHLPLLILLVPTLLTGRGGGIAWEAHLGGLLFGMLAGPRFLRLGK